jgi:hypothetical protein
MSKSDLTQTAILLLSCPDRVGLVSHLSHKDTLRDLIRKERDLERLVLARALLYHSEHRILVHGRKTIVFE